ncbi:unnamed protein product [Ambrosiozyma monospora]|uniref:Unnamed protein product n=1 Tax=Ambrosiozyma monospora TaxID=43982 RepID=A0A9W7DH48_AMBMO|nr:unnamed protein product [Ambrosiozyma monospora]
MNLSELRLHQTNNESWSTLNPTHKSEILNLYTTFIGPKTRATASQFLQILDLSVSQTESPWQTLYLQDPKLELIVATVTATIKPSSTKDKYSVLISYVATHESYRKLGIMSKLLQTLVDLYESTHYNIECPTIPFEIALETKQPLSDFIKAHIKPVGTGCESYFWYLYSIVGLYYSRFGFHRFPNFQLYTRTISSKARNIPSKFILEKNEEFITQGNIDEFLKSTRSTLSEREQNLKPNQRGVSLTSDPSVIRFNKLDQFLYKDSGIDPKPIGFSISTTGGDAVVYKSYILVTMNCQFDGLSVYRLGTDFHEQNNEHKTLLNKHLIRINKFLDWLTFTGYLKLTGNKGSANRGAKGSIALVKGDVFCEQEGSGSGTRDEILKLLVKNGWKDGGEMEFLTCMLKDFGKVGDGNEGLDWVNNGQWCLF